jgi:O-acetyl-ADP-ribose deacetylase (regulator of RNase III)
MLLGARLIINFPTKTHWRLPSEYNYVEQALIALAEFIVEGNIKSVALPALGCGNGGLDWLLVKDLISRQLGTLDIIIEVYEPTL